MPTTLTDLDISYHASSFLTLVYCIFYPFLVITFFGWVDTVCKFYFLKIKFICPLAISGHCDGGGAQSYLTATPWTAARQAPLSMGFPRQEYWSGFPFPTRGDFPNPEIKPTSLASLALAGRFFTTVHLGIPFWRITTPKLLLT